MIQGLIFYVFAAVLVTAAAMVIAARNPVHSVLYLILAFFNAAALFVLIGAEFLAMMLVVVYVGAVAVLFLFVVMMLDINFAELRAGFLRYLPVGGAIGIVFAIELMIVVGNWAMSPGAAGIARAVAPTPDRGQVANTDALGRVIYTDYVLAFQVAGLVLLVAMIGAIVLTLRERPGVRRQSIARQVGRRVEDSVAVVKVKSGEGA